MYSFFLYRCPQSKQLSLAAEIYREINKPWLVFFFLFSVSSVYGNEDGEDTTNAPLIAANSSIGLSSESDQSDSFSSSSKMCSKLPLNDHLEVKLAAENSNPESVFIKTDGMELHLPVSIREIISDGYNIDSVLDECKDLSLYLMYLSDYLTDIELLLDVSEIKGNKLFENEIWRLKKVKIRDAIFRFRYWVANEGKARDFLSLEEFEKLKGSLPESLSKAISLENDEWYRKSRKAIKFKEQEANKLAREELDILVRRAMSNNIDTEGRNRMNLLLSDIDILDSDAIDIPLNGFSNYPNVVSRFSVGMTFYSSDKLADKISPTVGFFYYRFEDPYDTNSGLHPYHSSTELLLTEIPSGEDSVDYSLAVSQMFYWPVFVSQVSNGDENISLLQGIVLKVSGYAFESAGDGTDAEPEIQYLTGVDIGYRAAFSPERYSELVLGSCKRFTSDSAPRCYKRYKAAFKVDVPGYLDDDKIQLGLELSYKTDRRDVIGSSIGFTVRYNTSFGKLLSMYN
jgi:hypothetical protein